MLKRDMHATIVRKRQPMAFNECKECCKDHRKLGEKLGNEPLNRVGKRHAMRIMSDAYGKGIVRAQGRIRVYVRTLRSTT